MEELPAAPAPPAARYAYKAFISYSHSADGKFAPSLQHSLQQFARPWNRLRAIRVFRDQTGLTVTPALWNTIATAMDSSEYFLLLASPHAAASHWVGEEVRHWLSQPRAERLLILLTDGNIVWNPAAAGPDRSHTDALPEALFGAAEEPLWLDLRWAKKEEHLSLQNPMWRDAIADLSSTLRGLPKDQLIGEDVRQYARATRFRRAAISGLVILAAALAIAAVLAIQQRDLAREQARIALARQLAAQSELIRTQQPERLPLAALMAAESIRNQPDSIETQQTLRGVLSFMPAPSATFTHQSAVASADISPDRQLVATAAAKDGALWRVADRARLASLDGADQAVSFSPDGTLIAGCCQLVAVWTAAGMPVLRLTAADLQGEPHTIAFSPDSRRLAVGIRRESTAGVVVFDLPTGAQAFRQQTTWSGNAMAIAFASSGDLALGFGETISIIDGTTWLQKRTLAPETGGVDLIAFRPDGRYLASSSNNTVTVFDLASGARQARLPIRNDAPGQGTVLRFSRDGRYLAAVGSFVGAIWEVPAWREAAYVRHGEFQTLSSLSFSDAAKEAVSCGWDGYCIGWSLESGARIHQFAHQHAHATDDATQRPIYGGVFAQQSSMLVTAGGDRTARLWDLAPVNEAGRSFCEGNLLVWSFLPDGRAWAAQGSLEIVHRACRSGGPDEKRVDRSDGVTVLAVSPSGRFVATHHGADRSLRISDTNTSQVVHNEISARAPLVEFLSDAAVLRIDDGNRLSTRRLDTAAPIWSETLAGIRALALSDDRQRILAAARADGGSVIRVLDAASGKRLLDQRVETDVSEVAFDRSARYAAAMLGSGLGVPEGLPQGTGLAIWDVAAARAIVSLPESQMVVGLAFSLDSRRVAIVRQQGGLIVQDLESGATRQTVGASVGPVAFSTSGRWLAFGGRSIRVLDTDSLQPIAQVDVIRQARRVEFRDDDRILAVDSFPDGDPRGLTQLLRWMPADTLGDACRVMPIDAAVRQWRQLFPGSPAPTPCERR